MRRWLVVTLIVVTLLALTSTFVSRRTRSGRPAEEVYNSYAEAFCDAAAHHTPFPSPPSLTNYTPAEGIFC